MQVLVLMVRTARDGIPAELVLQPERLVRSIRHPHMIARITGPGRITSKFSNSSSLSCHLSWSTEDFISAHMAVRGSGVYNFEGCMIPIPSAIRHDRLEAALGSSATPKERRVISLLRYGMPINCNPDFGIHKQQKNHFSAIIHKKAIDNYLIKNVHSQAMLGPFKQSPISNLCFSPLMKVPKEDSDR